MSPFWWRRTAAELEAWSSPLKTHTPASAIHIGMSAESHFVSQFPELSESSSFVINRRDGIPVAIGH
jgi:hypothetical protein